MAATLAREKNDCKRMQKPKSEMPYTQKYKKMIPVVEFVKTVGAKMMTQRIEIIVTTIM